MLNILYLNALDACLVHEPCRDFLFMWFDIRLESDLPAFTDAAFNLGKGAFRDFDKFMMSTVQQPPEATEGTHRVVAGDIVEIHYIGWVASNGNMFDTSVYRRLIPLRIVVGLGGAVTCIDKGVVGMMVGEVRRLYCPSFAAYGSHGSRPMAPPGASIVFEILLMAVDIGAAADALPAAVARRAAAEAAKAAAWTAYRGTVTAAGAALAAETKDAAATAPARNPVAHPSPHDSAAGHLEPPVPHTPAGTDGLVGGNAVGDAHSTAVGRHAAGADAQQADDVSRTSRPPPGGVAAVYDPRRCGAAAISHAARHTGAPDGPGWADARSRMYVPARIEEGAVPPPSPSCRAGAVGWWCGARAPPPPAARDLYGAARWGEDEPSASAFGSGHWGGGVAGARPTPIATEGTPSCGGDCDAAVPQFACRDADAITADVPPDEALNRGAPRARPHYPTHPLRPYGGAGDWTLRDAVPQLQWVVDAVARGGLVDLAPFGTDGQTGVGGRVAGSGYVAGDHARAAVPLGLATAPRDGEVDAALDVSFAPPAASPGHVASGGRWSGRREEATMEARIWPAKLRLEKLHRRRRERRATSQRRSALFDDQDPEAKDTRSIEGELNIDGLDEFPDFRGEEDFD